MILFLFKMIFNAMKAQAEKQSTTANQINTLYRGLRGVYFSENRWFSSHGESKGMDGGSKQPLYGFNLVNDKRLVLLFSSNPTDLYR